MYYACLAEQSVPQQPPTDTASDPSMLGSWIRAAQICAHDRRTFAAGGSGRLSIGLYALYYFKWLEHFPPEQFLWLRMESQRSHPRDYMNHILTFLDIEPLPNNVSAGEADWVNEMLRNSTMNSNKIPKQLMLMKTRKLLEAFYRPYDELLWALLGVGRATAVSPSYGWGIGTGWGGREHLQHYSVQETKARDVDHNPHQANAGLEMTTDDRNDDGSGDHKAESHKRASPSDPISADDFPVFLFPKPFALDDLSDLASHAPHLADSHTTNITDMPFNIWLERGDIISRDIWQQQLSIQQKLFPKLKSVRRTTTHDIQPFVFEDLNIEDRQLVIETYRTSLPSYYNAADAKAQVCVASFAQDIIALQFLLHDMGVPLSSLLPSAGPATAPLPRHSHLRGIDNGHFSMWHCLTYVHFLQDAHSKSYVFAVLKNKTHWLDDYVHPAMYKGGRSVLG